LPTLETSRHGSWSSPLVGLLAIAAASLGLGNLWRFPTLIVTHGGLAFVLVYAVALVVLALPVLLAEFHVGAMGRRGAIASLLGIAEREGLSRWWGFGGGCALAAAFILLVLLSITAAWVCGYLFRLGTGDLLTAVSIDAEAVLNAFTLDPERVMFWLTLFLVVVAVIVMNGLRRGVGPTVVVLVLAAGLVLGLLVWLAVDPAQPPGLISQRAGFAVPALGALVSDLLDLRVEAIVAAFQQAFATVAVGVGVMATYAAAMPQRVWAFSALGAVLVLNLLAALGVSALLAMLLVDGVPVSGLFFEHLPIALAQRPDGRLVVALLYGLLILLLLSAALALAHTLTSALMDLSRLHRQGASLLVGTAVWTAACGVVVIHASAVRLQLQAGEYALRLLEWTVTWLVPSLIAVSALLALLLLGWALGPRQLTDWLEIAPDGAVATVVGGLIRWVAPVLLIMMLGFTISGLLATGTD
jgi:neurotransmitter:Na+ symporter, NSS family